MSYANKPTHTVLISGATGKVGRHLTPALIPYDLQYRLLSRKPGDQENIVIGDLDQPSSLFDALQGCDKLFFSVPFSDALLQHAENLLAAAREVGIRQIVRLSAWRAGELPDNKMAALHGQIDAQVRESGIPFTILRCNSFWQNLTEMYWPMMQRTGVLALPEGDAQQAFIDAKHIADTAARVFATPDDFAGQTLDLAGPDTLTYSQALARLNQQHGTHFRFQPLSETDAEAGYRRFGLSDTEIAVLLSLSRSLARGDMAG